MSTERLLAVGWCGLFGDLVFSRFVIVVDSAGKTPLEANAGACFIVHGTGLRAEPSEVRNRNRTTCEQLNGCGIMTVRCGIVLRKECITLGAGDPAIRKIGLGCNDKWPNNFSFAVRHWKLGS